MPKTKVGTPAAARKRVNAAITAYGDAKGKAKVKGKVCVSRKKRRRKKKS